MILKPQDIVILLKLVSLKKPGWSYLALAHALFMSTSEVHAGIKRAEAARLMDLQRRKPVKKALEEFLVHGVKYAYPPSRGRIVRGMPTGYAASPLVDLIIQPDELPPVWPYSEGKVRGQEFSPLYKSVPMAAASDNRLYELLALLDAIRDGRAREKNLAARELKARLRGAYDQSR